MKTEPVKPADDLAAIPIEELRRMEEDAWQALQEKDAERKPVAERWEAIYVAIQHAKLRASIRAEIEQEAR